MENGFNTFMELFFLLSNSFNLVFGFLPAWVLFLAGAVVTFSLGVLAMKLLRG